ncbi:MAG: hypothetical protein ACE5RN_08485 [Nitrosopumilaceae archaeon]
MASANSAIGFESEPIIDYFKTGVKFKFKILDLGIHAIFIPSFSWVKKTILDKDRNSLLKHEQGHFDIVEEIVRKSTIKTTTLFRKKFFKVEGKNISIAKKNAIFQVTIIRKGIEDKLKKELQSEETKYDIKTNHGLIAWQQEKYNRRFKKLR